VPLAHIPTSDAVRYRNSDSVTNAFDELDFSGPVSDFSTLGKFSVSDPFVSDDHFLAIYNVGVPGADAYDVSSIVITPPGTTITISDGAVAGEDHVALNPAFQFGYASPGQRVFLASGPLTYLCNRATGTLTKYTGHSLAVAQSPNAASLTGAGGIGALVARDLTGCTILYDAGTAQRAGLVTLDLTVSRDGERVRLLHQVHVENVP
jgi:MSHA biogenesis protein MshO